MYKANESCANTQKYQERTDDWQHKKGKTMDLLTGQHIQHKEGCCKYFEDEKLANSCNGLGSLVAETEGGQTSQQAVIPHGMYKTKYNSVLRVS